MRILEVVHFFSPFHGGGSIDVVYNLSKYLTKIGHEVWIYTSDFELDPEYINSLKEVHINVFHSWLNFNAFTFTPNMISKLKQEIAHFDVIHMHNYRTFQNIVVRRYAKKNKVPYIVQAHGSLPMFKQKQRLKWLYDRFFGYTLLKDSSKVISFSQLETKQYLRMDVPEEKIEVIPNGIVLPEYGNLPPAGSFKKRFSIESDKKIVLYLGRIHKLKGIEFLIKSFAHLVKNGVKNAKLVLAGVDEGYLNVGKELAQSLGIYNDVLFTGFLTEKLKFSAYIDSTMVIYPSQYEPFGLVSLEAASFSKPIIVANSTPMSKIVKEGQFGFSVKYGDIKNLAELIEQLLADDVLANEMGTRGQRYVAENYSIEKVVDKLESLYAQFKI